MHLPLLAGLFMVQWGWLFPLPFRLPSSQGRAGWTGSSSRASGPRLLTSWSPEGGKGWTLSQPRTYSGSFQSEGSQLLSCPKLDCYLFDNTTEAQPSKKVNSKSGSSTQEGKAPSAWNHPGTETGPPSCIVLVCGHWKSEYYLDTSLPNECIWLPRKRHQKP